MQSDFNEPTSQLSDAYAAPKICWQVTLPCAVIIAIGTLLPWSEGFRWSERGIANPYGAVVLAGAIALLLVSILGGRDRIDDRQYFVLAAIVPAVCLLPCAIFWILRTGAPDPAATNLLGLFWLRIPRVEAGAGWYLSAACSLLSLVWIAANALEAFVPEPKARRHGRALNWPSSHDDRRADHFSPYG